MSIIGRIHAALLVGLLLAGCGSVQTQDQLRLLREELSIVREKLDRNQQQLLVSTKQVTELQGQVRLLSGNIEKKPYCKLRMPGRMGSARPVTGRPVRGTGVGRLISPFGVGPRSAPDLTLYITHLGPGRYRIKRKGLNLVLGNTTLLARSGRLVPSVRNGRPNGFKLYAIRPGSVYALLGLRNGDTITSVNGNAITTPSKALEIYTKLRNANKLTIQFIRRSRPMVHRYTIVN